VTESDAVLVRVAVILERVLPAVASVASDRMLAALEADLGALVTDCLSLSLPLPI
jgi:hypothetical protein